MNDQLAIIYTDGGARGNPGPAGCSAVLTQDGKTLCGIGKYLGETTNNVAEYTGLLIALEKALEMQLKDVEVRMDSELIVKQMTGQYKVKNEGLIPLFQRAKTLSSRFSSFRIVHVRREMNKAADRLANKAMDARQDVTTGD